MNSRNYMSNGGQNGSGDSYSQKRKYDSVESSKVVHISNIPFDTNEEEINSLCSPFGVPEKLIMMKNKNQAFVELESEYAATSLVDYFQLFDILLRGNKLFIQYSNHKRLVKQEDEYDPFSKNLNSPVLNVHISNMTCPISKDVIYQIFSKQGKVLKIVTYNKLGEFGALIQFPDHFTAMNVKLALDGQNIYNNCCTLNIDFYKNHDLTINSSDPNCHDYTRSQNERSLLGSMPFSSLNSNIPSLAASVLGPQLNNMAMLHNVMGPNMHNMNPDHLQHNKRIHRSPSLPNTPVLLASNLSEEMSDPDRIFALFGAFGDVHKVKILYNKRDAALVQMMDITQAGMVLDYLQSAIVFGKEIRITPSKYHEISFTSNHDKEEHHELLTKDYSNSPLHRYRKIGSKNYQNICAPSSVLHISNIPSTVTEDDIRHIFKDSYLEIERFKFFPKSRNMALIRMANEEEAIRALILLNNHPVSGDMSSGHNTSSERHLRISFSQSKI